jgi:hypothetical protein
MVKKERFKYRPREKDTVKKRANQSGGLFDSIFKSQFATFTPKEGDYRLRVLPPTWPDAQHFGLDIYVHYGIGSDNQSYLCLDKMLGEKCPICEQRKVAERSGDPEYARSLVPTKRVLVWVLDRADEESGPQLWSMAWTIDRDLANLSIDKASGELLLIDDPEDGYDIEFVRTGKGLKTKYSGTAVARRSSPLADDQDQADEWLKFVQDNPLTEVLQYFDYDHIASVAEGAAKKEDEEEDEDEPQTRSKSKARARVTEEEEDEGAPPRRSKPKPVKEEEDEDEDLPPRRKPAAAKDEEEDEDEQPRRKPKPVQEEEEDEDDRPTKRPPTKTSRSKDEDENEEDEDEPPRRSKPKPVKEEEDEYDCLACSDTGKNSKGGFCVCAKGRKLKAKAQTEEADEDEDDRPRRKVRE